MAWNREKESEEHKLRRRYYRLKYIPDSKIDDIFEEEKAKEIQKVVEETKASSEREQTEILRDLKAEKLKELSLGALSSLEDKITVKLEEIDKIRSDFLAFCVALRTQTDKTIIKLTDSVEGRLSKILEDIENEWNDALDTIENVLEIAVIEKRNPKFKENLTVLKEAIKRDQKVYGSKSD
jgi:hypothetical protein